MRKKRALALFAAYMISLAFLAARLFSLSGSETGGEYQSATAEQRRFALTAAVRRAGFYDRNGLLLVNNNYEYIAVIDPNCDDGTYLEFLGKYTALTDDENRNLLGTGIPFIAELNELPPRDTAASSGGITVFRVSSRYYENPAAVHLIGYLDSAGRGVTGLERVYDEFLHENTGRLTIHYEGDAARRTLSGLGLTVDSDSYTSPAGIRLTVDTELQRVCEDALGEREGAVVLLNLNAEILAMCSSPGFDPGDIAASLGGESGEFLNRALQPCNVGSIFKLVVAAAALENNIDIGEVNCVGYTMAGDVRFPCHRTSGHGMVNMRRAIAASCNPYFIELAKAVGAENIITMAEALGFGRVCDPAQGLTSQGGCLPTAAELSLPAALANFSIGQGRLLATPLQYAAALCAAVNGGVYTPPSVVKSFITPDGGELAPLSQAGPSRVMSQLTAARLRSYLKNAVETGTASAGKPDYGGAGAKTASAQTGQLRDGEEILHTWYTGFFPTDDPEYICVVFVENGVSGGESAGPVFKEIADAIITEEPAPPWNRTGIDSRQNYGSPLAKP